MIKLEFKRPIDESSSLLQLYVRLLGAIFFLAMVDTAWQWPALCGENGLFPVAEFADQARTLYAPWQFFRFPSLFWINQSDTFGIILLTLGAVGAMMAVIDRLATLGLVICYAVWLSIVNFGGDFFAFEWDTLLLEAGFLGIFISWLRNAGVGRKLVVAAMILLNFRLWFSSGIIKVLPLGETGFHLDYLMHELTVQPMPTQVAWWLSQSPEWLTAALGVIALALQLVLPVLLIWKRTRWIPMLGYMVLSLGTFLLCNQGWLSLLACCMTLPMLVGTKYGGRFGKWLSKSENWNRYLRIDPQYERLRGWPRYGGAAALQFQMAIQLAWTVLLFFPIGKTNLNYLNYVAYRPEVVEWEGESGPKSALLTPLRAASNFRMANPYGSGNLKHLVRHELRLEASTDTSGGFWFTYPHTFKPGKGVPPSFFAPISPRFESQMQLIADDAHFHENLVFHHLWGQNICWENNLKKALWEGNQVDRWFPFDPMEGKQPQAIRFEIRELDFSDKQTKDEDGSWWHSRTVLQGFLDKSHTSAGCQLMGQ